MKTIQNRLVYFIFLFQIQFSFGQSDSLESCNSSCICSSDPTPAGVMISHIHSKNEWMISYRYMNMGMNDLLSGTKSISDQEVFTNYLMSPNSMRMDMHMLMGMYGITDRLTAMLMLNYNSSSMDMSMLTSEGHNHKGMVGMSTSSSSNHIMKTSGFSDTKIQFLYGLKKHKNYQIFASVGCNIPTGSIQVKGSSTDMMYSNNRLPYGTQLGSGTFDFLPGVTYFYQKNDFSYNVQVSSTLRLGYNKIGYNLGNDVSFNSWFAYNWFENLSSSLRLEGNISNRIQGIDPTIYAFNEPSSNRLNYGSKKIISFLGTTYKFQKGTLKNNRIGVEFGLPIKQNVNGIQMKQSQSINVSWSFTF
jgi:hypothetical protein